VTAAVIPVYTGSMLKPETWTREALCAETDPEVFFPEKGGFEGAAPARAICNTCPVIGDCLEYALRTRQMHGVWGGTTRDERVALWRMRRTA
jgi:WhiB family redox-sensing transcriptional regulator